MNLIDYIKIRSIILEALKEDIGSADITSESTIDNFAMAEANFLAKEDGIFAGEKVLESIFHLFHPEASVEILEKDGNEIKKGTILAKAYGKAKLLLQIERTALNFIQRMSGIATLTNQFVKKISHTKAQILDTRKTCPGLRFLDKMAVKIGGGKNHRFGLYDMILIKDNHIEAARGIKPAVQKARNYLAANNLSHIKIEVECANLQMVQEALDSKCDIIMLDNFTIDEMKKAVKLINGIVPVEASGNVNLNTVAEIAETGVNYISVGALTHSVKALDISMKIKLKK